MITEVIAVITETHDSDRIDLDLVLSTEWVSNPALIAYGLL